MTQKDEFVDRGTTETNQLFSRKMKYFFKIYLINQFVAREQTSAAIDRVGTIDSKSATVKILIGEQTLCSSF